MELKSILLVKEILDKMDMIPAQVINILLLYKLAKGIFIPSGDFHVPNQETAKAISEARKGKEAIRCENTKDLFCKLGIE